jgi:hypothetical protein
MQHPSLTGAQQIALEQLLGGATMTAAANAASVDRSTVWRWQQHDANFIAELNRRRSELRAAHEARLGSLVDRALTAVEKALESGDARIALRVLRGVGLLDGASPEIGPSDPDQVVYEAERAERKRHFKQATDESLDELYALFAKRS